MTPSGILKNVKDHIRACGHCQSRRSADDGSGPRLFSQQGRRRANTDEEDEEDEEADDGSLFADPSRSRLAKAKHELVFVSLPV